MRRLVHLQAKAANTGRVPDKQDEADGAAEAALA